MSKKKNQIDEAIVAAMARAEDVLAERSRIEGITAKTADDMKKTEAELEHALERLAVEEAAMALSGDDHETAAQRSVQSLRMRLEGQQARLRGLNRKMIENEDVVREANNVLTSARDAWMRARAAEFSVEYKEAVANMAAVLRTGAAIGDALGAEDISCAMRGAKFYDPENLSYSMIDMEPMHTDPATGMMVRYPVWEDDPAASAVYNALVSVRLASEKLDGIAREIRHRRETAAREEQRRRFEAKPNSTTVTYEVNYPPEYSAVPGVEVVQATLGK
jgi:uncharacterized protein YukE